MKGVADSARAPAWWWPLRQHRLWLVCGGLPVAGAVAALILMLEPVFESRALVEVQTVAADTAEYASQPGAAGNPGVAGNLPFAGNLQVPHSELMNTQREIMTSATVVGTSRSALRVEVIPHTRMLAVHYQANDPRAAQAGAASVVNAYVDFTGRRQVEQVADAAALLIHKLETVLAAPALSLRDVGTVEEAFSGLPVIPADLPFAASLGLPNLADGFGSSLTSTPTNTLSSTLSSTLGTTLSSTLGAALVQQAVESYDNSLGGLISARVVDAATLPQEPLPGLHPFWIVLGYLSAIMIPAAILVARFHWRETLDFATDIQRQLGVPCLGSLPAASAGVDPTSALDSGFVAALQRLRTAVQLLRSPYSPHDLLEQYPRGRIILVTSGSRGEGKTTVAINLALALGRMEKVLLIDADMRGKRSCLGLPVGAPGLSHLIVGAAQLRDCVHSLVDRRVDVIPAGIVPPNPEELLASKRFRRVLEMLERRYDTIVVDAPGLEDVRDTQQLARHCSDLLFVISAGSVRAETARHHLTQLRESDVKISGVVLNRVGHAGKSAVDQVDVVKEQILALQAKGSRQDAAGARAFA